ncbi:enoyl-CoA hydratase/isomerase family protein [Rhodococcus koreensis]
MTLRTEDGVAIVEIRNPRTRNSISGCMRQQLISIFDQLASTNVSAVVLTGHGRHFSSGMDIAEILPDNANDVADEMAAVERSIAAVPVPTIAAIDGYCVGGGAQLAVACDIRIATERTSIAITPAKLGIVYPAESVWRLGALVGSSVAKLLLFTAESITSDQAIRFGLVSQVVHHEDLHTTAINLARTISARSPLSVAAAKSMINAATVSVEQVIEDQARWRKADNPDIEVGLAAFSTKSQPVFARPACNSPLEG